MYYDDEARRFNFLSGFLLGAVLGTGIALAARPRRARTTLGYSSASEAALNRFRAGSEKSVISLRKAAKGF
jgi:hypothetical protein